MFTSSTDQLLQCPSRALLMDGRWKSNVEIAPNCPRCASTNTKFCYYNNYSLSQPRYFCKGCRRYWTKGGSLRNVPVGGGCRKNRRGRSVRVAQGTDSVSVTNYSRKVTTSSSESDPPNDNSFGNNGSDIDLAAVFANFLNQNSSSDIGQELAKDENLLESIEQEEMIIDCQQPTYVIEETEPSFPLVQGEEKIHELNDDEFLPLLGHDQGVQEDLWCDDSSIGLQNFSWQPMVQLQEFGSSLSCDDQLKISTNPVIDNLSCFDMSGFEVFFKA